MTWFKNLGLRSKMLVSFMLVIALTMALVVLAVGRIRIVGQDYQAVIEHPIALRATLQEFSLNFTNIRRVNSVMALHNELEEERHAQLISEEKASFYNAQTLLDRARAIVSANPALTPAEKERRLANNDTLRSRLDTYYADVTEPIAQAAFEHDAAAQSALIDRADAVARSVSEALDGMLASARETAAAQTLAAEKAEHDTVTILIAISVAAAVFAFAAALYIAGYIARPLAPLTNFMTNMAASGDIAFSPKDAATLGRFSRNQDEVGRLIVAAIAFVSRIQEVGKALDAVSEGDLTSGIPKLSDRDSMGFAFKRMLTNLNGMCAEIARSSVQVATGANQVTAAAQALSSGSTEQAASIEELSVAIASVDDMTKETADIARRAADLACGIKALAERSSIQMEGMMTAIDGINQASQAIRKIIRTIDEIAFQTNILAVNAAVEAAHAGKYGRGFSVVATAVRNLAAKSAEAAKDTERLIANSIEKAEEGVRIAGETSASLTDIVSGINDNNLMVTEIARLSEDQSSSISQINVGVSQVTKVVYRNSSTAEESAAASEEMARQSVTLQKLAGQFRLAEGSRARIAEEEAEEARRQTALLLEG